MCSRVRVPCKKYCVELFIKIFEKSWLHSGVNDTAVICTATNFAHYLREFEAIFEKALTCVSGSQRKLFDKKKNRGPKSRVRVYFKTTTFQTNVTKINYNNFLRISFRNPVYLCQHMYVYSTVYCIILRCGAASTLCGSVIQAPRCLLCFIEFQNFLN
jgi:hypothetical protein